jgi:hypothetical protein
MPLKECLPSDDFLFKAAEVSNLKSVNRLLEFNATAGAATAELVVCKWVFDDTAVSESVFSEVDATEELAEMLTATEDRDADDNG